MTPSLPKGTLNHQTDSVMSDFYVEYSAGPRYIDGVNVDADVSASIPKVDERSIDEPVTGYKGTGYEPGQKNLDGSDL